VKRRTFILVLLLVAGTILHLNALEDKKADGEKKKEETKGPIPPQRRDVPGKRYALSLGNLYVPEFFNKHASPTTDFVFFFHGASWCAEQNFFDARKNAVMVSITVKDYGYPKVFNDPQKLAQLVEDTTRTLAQNEITTKPLGSICLASFSGGYSAIREILKQGAFDSHITDVVLADSLYPAKNKETDKIEPESIAPFLEYAKKASEGQGNFFFSHLYPPEEKYRNNTTTLAANYLIENLGAEKQEASGANSRGARLLYRADKGNFHVLGYSGMTTQDHFEHFYALSDLLRETSLFPVREHLRPFRDFQISPAFDEQIKRYTFEPGVTIHINAPNVRDFDPNKPVRIIFFALPNGNTIDQTIGKKVKKGVDWHFGIQHIGAQTRRLREVIREENIIVAYVEAEKRSWPSWRQKRPDNPELIRRAIESVQNQFPGMKASIHLSGHSGGGSFIFGFLNSVEQIPSSITRISFLDSNYAYSDGERHGDKLIEWLKRSPENHLVVICYDDRNIMLDGKLVVGPNGGTYRRTLQMVGRFERDLGLVKTEEGDVIRYRGLNNQVDILIHKNPANKILHTVLVGDMNGFIHAETSGTPYENKAGIWGGPLAYEKWIQQE